MRQDGRARRDRDHRQPARRLPVRAVLAGDHQRRDLDRGHRRGDVRVLVDPASRSASPLNKRKGLIVSLAALVSLGIFAFFGSFVQTHGA
ncbi:MAG: hypothetical protein MZU97_01530 [Bacillus subtilis]|nr:hypothetical protein [Bacillus subtilis]